MADACRRYFLKHYFLRQVGEIVSGFAAGVKEAEKAEAFDSFFGSYESSYALTLAYPDDILMETARVHGIETEGREKNDIVRELFIKQGGY
ncbi:MAG: hypothetical protein WAK57_06435 [Desulfobacterales bacterium]